MADDLDATLGRCYRQSPDDIQGMRVWTKTKLKRRAWALDYF